MITKTAKDAITTYRVVDVFPLSCTEIAILHHGTFNFLSDKKYFSKQSLNSGHQDITKSICVITPDFPFLKKNVPSKHSAPFHPLLQPSLQAPVMWWQIPDVWQNELHLCWQPIPYFPGSQTEKRRKTF